MNRALVVIPCRAERQGLHCGLPKGHVGRHESAGAYSTFSWVDEASGARPDDVAAAEPPARVAIHEPPPAERSTDLPAPYTGPKLRDLVAVCRKEMDAVGPLLSARTRNDYVGVIFGELEQQIRHELLARQLAALNRAKIAALNAGGHEIADQAVLAAALEGLLEQFLEEGT